ncbi:MAG: hypothetical protein M3Q07_00430, partial [Pseudobdellovibrionaceae bacterium]|nr:hypothetical protein [Pseudobdellovibrionaceae bacterium]
MLTPSYPVSLHVSDIVPAAPAFDEILFQIGSLYNGGGTSFLPPLMSALETIEKHEKMQKADLVFLTDGESEALIPAFKKQFDAKKEELGFTVYGILLQ